MKKFILCCIPQPKDSEAIESLIGVYFQDIQSLSENILFLQHQQWSEVRSWLINLANKLYDTPPNFLMDSTCLAEAIDCFYKSLPDDFDGDKYDFMIDELYEFRVNHDLRFAFRGTDIPSVLIGLYKNNLTVSWVNKLGQYEHQIISQIYWNDTPISQIST